MRLGSLLAYLCIIVSVIFLGIHAKAIFCFINKLSPIELINFGLNILDIAIIAMVASYLVNLDRKIEATPGTIMYKVSKMIHDAVVELLRNKNLL